MMRRIAAFGEDEAHKRIVGALVERFARQYNVDVVIDWRRSSGGHGRVINELTEYLSDVRSQRLAQPDLVVVATDANCKGYNERVRELPVPVDDVPVSLAIPDPHIERWLLLDGQAFGAVLGRGCTAPDRKCIRDHYKKQLREEIEQAGEDATFGGVEYAVGIVMEMDIRRASTTDRSFGRFTESLERTFRDWQT